MDSTESYTLAEWRVRPGREAEFVKTWEALAALFSALPAPPRWGTLLRSEAEPRLFYSFGPWRVREHIEAMRADPAVQAHFARLNQLCDSMQPGVYRLVRHVEVPSVGAPALDPQRRNV